MPKPDAPIISPSLPLFFANNLLVCVKLYNHLVLNVFFLVIRVLTSVHLHTHRLLIMKDIPTEG